MTLYPFRLSGLQLMFLLLVAVGLCSACATFEQVGTRKVEHTTRCIGPVSEQVINYEPPIALSFPTSKNSDLRLKCEKTVRLKVIYKTPSHEERVLRREVSQAQKNLEFVLNPGDIINGIIALPFLPIALIEYPFLMDYDKRIETKYERIPGSDATETSFLYEEKILPAERIRLSITTLGDCMTDEEGICVIKGTPEKYDDGVQLTHGGSGQAYLVRRTKHQREVEYKEPWHEEAIAANTLIGAGLTIRNVKNILTVGGGPWAIAGAVIVDLITAAVIGYVIDIATTETLLEDYYRWTIIPEDRSGSVRGQSG